MNVNRSFFCRGAVVGTALFMGACTMPALKSTAAQPQAMMDPGMTVAQPAAPMVGHGQMGSGGQPLPLPAQQDVSAQALANANSILQMQNKLIADFDGMRERVRRVERAMIRLDRRMKLVEKNELNRMSGLEPAAGTEKPMAQSMGDGAHYQPVSHPTVQVPATRTPQHYGVISSPFGRSTGAKFQTVSYQPSSGDVAIKSRTNGRAAVGVKSLESLPSLADEETGNALPNGGVQIWTVAYLPNKVWPSREHLAGASAIVDDLKKGKKVTIFARGQRPSSGIFKDRLQAIGKYLSTVAEVDSVPIAAMPAQHLPSDTIEIMATQ